MAGMKAKWAEHAKTRVLAVTCISALRFPKTSPSSTMATYNFETVKATFASDGVLHVELNRPNKLNAFNQQYVRCLTCVLVSSTKTINDSTSHLDYPFP